MASHLRFDSENGLVASKTQHGAHTIELLQLNDKLTVEWRISTLRLVQLCKSEIDKLGKQISEISKAFKTGKITEEEFHCETTSCNSDLLEMEKTLKRLTGDLPLKPLRKHRFGLNLIS